MLQGRQDRGVKQGDGCAWDSLPHTGMTLLSIITAVRAGGCDVQGYDSTRAALGNPPV